MSRPTFPVLRSGVDRGEAVTRAEDGHAAQRVPDGARVAVIHPASGEVFMLRKSQLAQVRAAVATTTRVGRKAPR